MWISTHPNKFNTERNFLSAFWLWKKSKSTVNSTYINIIAFARNATSFKIFFIIFFSLSPSRRFQKRTGKRFLPIFLHALPRKHMTSIGLISLRKLVNAFVRSWHAMALEIHINDAFEREHVKSCPSTAKNRSPLPQSLFRPH